CRRLIQPIKERVHPAYEYWGPSDPTHEQNREVSQEEIIERCSEFFRGVVCNSESIKAHSLRYPADPEFQAQHYCPVPLPSNNQKLLTPEQLAAMARLC
ncbi:unnamed protein product, partial [Urochloa humidicola]